MTVKVGEIACSVVIVDAIVVKERGSHLLVLVHYWRNVYAC